MLIIRILGTNSWNPHMWSSDFSDLQLLIFSFSAPDQPVYNLLQLLSESGAPCQEDLPAWLFMFLHSCQDETGQLKALPQKYLFTSLRPKYTGGNGCMPEHLLLLLSVCSKEVHGVDIRVPLFDLQLQFTPVLYFWNTGAIPTGFFFFFSWWESCVDSGVTEHEQTRAFGLSCVISHLLLHIAS